MSTPTVNPYNDTRQVLIEQATFPPSTYPTGGILVAVVPYAYGNSNYQPSSYVNAYPQIPGQYHPITIRFNKSSYPTGY